MYALWHCLMFENVSMTHSIYKANSKTASVRRSGPRPHISHHRPFPYNASLSVITPTVTCVRARIGSAYM